MNNKEAQKNLKILHDKINASCPSYISMLTVGSTAVGDKWIKGRSDYDILLIFKKDFQKHLPRISKILSTINFDDSFLFVPFNKQDYIKTTYTTFDFCNKFKTKTIFGDDISKEVKLPNKKETLKIYESDINQIITRLERRLLNSVFWSTTKTRSVFWSFFKHIFMLLAVKNYYETGSFPKSKKDIVKAVNSKTLGEILNCLNNINTSSKKKIINTSEMALKLLKSL